MQATEPQAPLALEPRAGDSAVPAVRDRRNPSLFHCMAVDPTIPMDRESIEAQVRDLDLVTMIKMASHAYNAPEPHFCNNSTCTQVLTMITRTN